MHRFLEFFKRVCDGGGGVVVGIVGVTNQNTVKLTTG